jgi:uncharacterized membrane protein YeiH
MRKTMYIIACFAIGIFAIYEQTKPNPNKFVMVGALAIFMIGLYSIMKKIPPKNDNNDEA